MIISRRAVKDEGDFCKPCLLKTKSIIEYILKKDAEKTFLRNHQNPKVLLPRTRACPGIGREQARGARRKQLLRQFDGKGASES